MTEPLSNQALAEIARKANPHKGMPGYDTEALGLLATIAADRAKIAALESALKGRNAIMVAAYLVAASPLHTTSVEGLRAALNAYDVLSDLRNTPLAKEAKA